MQALTNDGRRWLTRRVQRLRAGESAGLVRGGDSAQRDCMADENTSPVDWTAADAFRAPMEVCWQFDCEISLEKLGNLYSKAKRSQWDAEEQIDQSIEIDPSGSIVDAQRNFFLRLPSSSACRRRSER